MDFDTWQSTFANVPATKCENYDSSHRANNVIPLQSRSSCKETELDKKLLSTELLGDSQRAGIHLLCHAMLCYAMLWYAMLCYAMLCYAMLCYAMLCYAMLWYAMLCYAMLCYAMLCYAMLCYAMLCYAMLCYAMLCYAMLCYVYSVAYCCQTKCYAKIYFSG